MTEMLETNQQLETCVRLLLFILKLYEQQLEASSQLRDTLVVLKHLMKEKLTENRVALWVASDVESDRDEPGCAPDA